MSTTTLHAACKSNDVAGLLRALQIPATAATVNDRDQYNMTPLQYVCQSGNVTAAEVLASCGADVNVKVLPSATAPTNVATSSDSLLHVAIRHNHYALALRLVELGANYYATDANGDDILHCLLNSEIASLVPLPTVALSSHHISKSNQGATETDTVLSLPSPSPPIKLINDLIINHGASINTKNRSGKTLLHRAAELGCVQVMQQLFQIESMGRNEIPTAAAALDSDNATSNVPIRRRLALCTIDVDAVNVPGESILHSALQNGHLQAAQLLLDKEANPNVKNRNGKTPLHIAAEILSIEMVNVLLAKGADVKAKTRNGKTALHLVAENLKSAPINTSIHSHYHQSRHYSRATAAENVIIFNGIRDISAGHEIVKVLLENSADPNAEDQGKETPLHAVLRRAVRSLKMTASDSTAASAEEAERNQCTKILSALLERNADVNAEDQTGDYPLHILARGGISTSQPLALTSTNAAPSRRGNKLVGDSRPHRAMEEAASNEYKYNLFGEAPEVNHQNDDINVPESTELDLVQSESIVDGGGNSKDDDNIRPPNTVLTDPSSCNFFSELFTLLLTNPNCVVNRLSRCGKSPLHVASEVGNFEAIKLLVSHGGNPNVRNHDNETPLHVALTSGRSDVILFLLDLPNININEKNKYAKTPLHSAAERGLTDIFFKLWSMNPSISEGFDHGGETILHSVLIHYRSGKDSASSSSLGKILTTLVSKLVEVAPDNLNTKNRMGKTPLHIAVENQNAEATQLLLNTNCVNPNIKNRNGCTPLHIACQRNNLPMVLQLLAFKANPNVPQDLTFDVPLRIASQNNNTEMMMALITHGADVNFYFNHVGAMLSSSQGVNGATPVASSSAASSAHNNNNNSTGDSLLHDAIRMGRTNVVMLLLDEPRTLKNVKNRDGKTPLHIAAEKANLPVVVALLNQTLINAPPGPSVVNLDATDLEGNTALIVALLSTEGDTSTNKKNLAATNSQSNRQDVALALLQAGANRNAPTKEGRAPLHLACERGFDRVVEALFTNNNNNSSQSQVVDVNAADRTGETPLHIAVLHRNPATVAALCARGADVNAKDQYGKTLLQYACSDGQTDLVELLLQHGGDAKVVHQLGQTLLHTAAEKGDMKMISLLIAKGVDVNAQNRNGRTALQMACERLGGELIPTASVATAITTNTAPPNPFHSSNSHGGRTLGTGRTLGGGGHVLGSRGGHMLGGSSSNPRTTTKSVESSRSSMSPEALKKVSELIVTLVKHGANPNILCRGAATPLQLACKRLDFAVCDVLINTGNANVNPMLQIGAPPLHYACALEANNRGNGLNSESKHLVEALLGKGANVEAKDKEAGQNALHVATIHRNVDAVKALLERNANPNATDSCGKTSLHFICESRNHIDTHLKSIASDIIPNTALSIAQALVSKGANVNAKDLEAKTPIQIACKSEAMLEVAAFLLENGADPNCKDQYNRTLLQYACSDGLPAMVKLLIRKGADVKVEQTLGLTLLHITAEKGDCAICEQLIEKGCNIDAKNRNGMTPLNIAADKNNGETALLLVTLGADPNVVPRNGFSPLQSACKFGNFALAEALVARGAIVNSKSLNGSSPLHYACEYVNNKRVHNIKNRPISQKNFISDAARTVELLLVHCADATELDSEGRTPLHVLVQNGIVDYDSSAHAALLLISAMQNNSRIGTNDNDNDNINLISPDSINIKDRSGQTALWLAVKAEISHHQIGDFDGYGHGAGGFGGGGGGGHFHPGLIPPTARGYNANNNESSNEGSDVEDDEAHQSANDLAHNGGEETREKISEKYYNFVNYDVETSSSEEDEDEEANTLYDWRKNYIAYGTTAAPPAPVVVTAAASMPVPSVAKQEPKVSRTLRIIRLLLANGANPNIRDNSGASPLIEAVYAFNLPLAESLLRAGPIGADILARDVSNNNARGGGTALHTSIMLGENSVAMTNMLLQLGADVTIRDKNGLRPIHIAVETAGMEELNNGLNEENPEVCKKLLLTLRRLLKYGSEVTRMRGDSRAPIDATNLGPIVSKFLKAEGA